jgi:ribonuclease VapC
MIIDTSALVAILQSEPEAESLLDTLLRAPALRMSAATFVEAAAVIDSRKDPVLSRMFDSLLKELGVEISPVTAEQATLARQAYRDFGRGSGHPAALNFGDCFSYAAAVAFDDALLFKGEDFPKTDVRAAVN